MQGGNLRLLLFFALRLSVALETTIRAGACCPLNGYCHGF
jgi:hypothetical protein